jgi:hypothetical protein
MSTKLPAIGGKKGPAAKKVVLSEDAMNSAMDRLYNSQVKRILKNKEEYNKEVDWNFRHNTVDRYEKKRTTNLSEHEKSVVAALYSLPMERKAHVKKELEKKFMPVQATTKQVLPEEKEMITDRLYNQSIQRKEQSLEAASKKVYGVPQPPPKLDKDRMKESLAHLYTEAVDKKKNADEKLGAKYSFPKVQTKKVPNDTLKSIVDRLATKPG